jgi:hypothetical protein
MEQSHRKQKAPKESKKEVLKEMRLSEVEQIQLARLEELEREALFIMFYYTEPDPWTMYH